MSFIDSLQVQSPQPTPSIVAEINAVSVSADTMRGGRELPRKDPEIETGNSIIRVLLVSPSEEDRCTLKYILRAPKWSLYAALDIPSALLQLRRGVPISLIICECDLSPGTWRDLWGNLSQMPAPPLLIVASQFADERLWAEALNVGAYDVLMKPFDVTEVIRSLSLGWLHSRNRNRRPAVMKAAAGM